MKYSKIKRLQWLTIAMAGFMLLLVFRAFYMQVINHRFYEEKSKAQLNRIFTLYPNRGSIFDRNKTPLALTEKRYSAYAIPSQIPDKREFAAIYTRLIGGSPAKLYDKINIDYPFVWLDRKLPLTDYQKLKGQKLTGLNFIPEQKRMYPNQTLAAHVLGFVGIDNQGLAGLEYTHDTFLKGSPGKIYLEGDPLGHRLISGKTVRIPPNDGGNITLTLDETIQYSTQKHLENGVIKSKSKGGYAIVMNPENGDILAMATTPSFNPNELPKVGESRKNRLIADVFEPGSVFKLVVVSAILEEEIATPGTVFKVPETIRIKGHTVREAHERDDDEKDLDEKTLTDILIHSLNVGTSILAEELGERRLYKYIKAYGFGDRTGVALPGEVKGLVRHYSQWSGIDYAMFSFGQGLAVTPLQIAANLSLVANEGERLKPRIIASKETQNGKSVKTNPKVTFSKVISKKTADQVTDMLVKNVEEGTGVLARIPGFKVAGKTGTAQKAREDGLGYQTDNYMASFYGFFPADNPQYAILVVMDSPKTSIYGGVVAAPVFKQIAEDIIRTKGMLPDGVR